MSIASAAKLLAVAGLALVATSGSSLVAADLCTTTQMDQLVSAAELVYSSTDCATINSDFSTATKDDVCESSCMDYLSSILDEFPDCEYGGDNLHSSLEYLLAECGMDGDSNAAAAGALASDATLVCLSGVAAAALALAGGN